MVVQIGRLLKQTSQSTFIGRAGSKNKGRISRFLANKCSIASRIDCFTDSPTTKFGEALRSQVEERLAFYETGSQPTKNSEAMARVVNLLRSQGTDGAVVEVVVDDDAQASSSKKDKKKDKKDKSSKKRKSEVLGAGGESTASAMEGVITNGGEVALDASEKKIKKSKKSKIADGIEGGPLAAAPPALDVADVSMTTELAKKEKKSKRKAADAAAVSLKHVSPTLVIADHLPALYSQITDPSTAEMTVDPVEVGDASISKAERKEKKKKRKSEAAV